jgi:transcriptional regulator with XRE-family HTH domain
VEKMSTQNQLSSRVEKFATEDNLFHFKESGLDNIYLIGIKYFVDEEGTTIAAEIPALKQLMRLIARDIVLSPLDLTGKEIRFLRKRLGKKATEYCAYLGFNPETLSRIEHEKQSISIQSQKLARLSYCVFSEDPELIDCARTILQTILEEIRLSQKKAKIVLRIDQNQEWKELKAA